MHHRLDIVSSGEGGARDAKEELVSDSSLDTDSDPTLEEVICIELLFLPPPHQTEEGGP